jgi:ketosteroid isomerase-like protein
MTMAEIVPALGPREVFALARERWLTNVPGVDADLLADDVVVEFPFAPPDRPSRFDGRAQFLAFAEPQQAALPVRFDAVRNVVVHDTADPEVIVVEYVIAGTFTTTGHQAAAPFVSVLRVRDGKVVHWREYQNPLAMAAVTEAQSGSADRTWAVAGRCCGRPTA